jgi:hypothetical protein
MSKLTLLMLSCTCVVVCAQAPKSGASATYVTPAEMASAMKTAPRPDAPLIDRPVRVVEAGGHYLGVAVVRRTNADQNALVHDKSTRSITCLKAEERW